MNKRVCPRPSGSSTYIGGTGRANWVSRSVRLAARDQTSSKELTRVTSSHKLLPLSHPTNMDRPERGQIVFEHKVVQQ